MLKSTFRVCLLAAAVYWIAVPAFPAHSANLIVVNKDGAGEGFNDTTPAAPVGGNTGTTIGAQRLIAFQFAANVWGGLLASNVDIRVGAQFNPLSCNATSAVLGQAGPNNYYRDFTGAPVGGTWFPVALANALHGTDNDPGNDDINAEFSSTIGTPGCLTNSGWYYGLDGHPPGNLIDFVSVLIHELGHGLGFLTIVDLSSGAKALGFNDTYMRFLEDHGATPSDYPSMSNAQRVAASKDTGNLHWVGPHVRAASGVLTAGRVGDHVRMFAPNPQQSGSSVSHWDTALTPNQIMEPNYTEPLHSPSLELPLFQDIGWTVLSAPPPPPPPTGRVVVNDFSADGRTDILWHQSGGGVGVWLMNGTSSFSQGGLGTVDTAWQIAGTSSLVQSTGDFDGDGRADFLWRHSGGGLGMWFMNGTTTKAQVGLGAVDTAWQIAGSGDFDGDGKADMLWRHNGGGLGIWLMNGATPKSQVGVGAVDTAWQIAGIGDFDGDGKADILWRHSGGGLGLWLMNGASPKVQVGLGAVDTSWQIVGVGDFDGDGKADILWRHTSGAASIWEMNGASIKSTPVIGTVDTAWGIVSVGDYDGDGKADILWRHTSGAASVWEMNGGSIKAAGVIGTIDTSWTVVE